MAEIEQNPHIAENNAREQGRQEAKLPPENPQIPEPPATKPVQVLGPGQQPFWTSDGMLAFALYLAGHPFADDAMWCVNFYTLDTLRKLGYKGIAPREAAKLAAKDGKPGTVKFIFKPMQDKRLLLIFSEQENMMNEGTGLARDVIFKLMEEFKAGKTDWDETMIRLACTICIARRDFMNGYKDMDPYLRVDSDERSITPMPDGRNLLTMGGFKIIAASASDATKEHMKL